MDDTHFTIRIPKFSGYKTLFVNIVAACCVLVAMVYPTFSPPDSATVGAAYETLTQAAVLVLAVVNVLLRLVTTKPVPFMAKSDDSSGGLPFMSDGGVTPYASKTHDMKYRPDAAPLAFMQTRHDLENLLTVPPRLSVGDAVALDAYISCGWPSCACHQPCAERRALARPDLVASDGEPTIQLTDEELRRDAGKARTSRPIFHTRGAVATFFAWLMMPSVMLGLALVPVAALGGCAAIQEVDAVVSAETVEQKAFALYGTFTVLEERAAVIVRDKAIPKNVRKAIQKADAVAKPLADRLRNLAVDLNAARMAYNAAPVGDSGGKVLAAVQALNAALVAFTPALQSMQTAMAKAG